MIKSLLVLIFVSLLASAAYAQRAETSVARRVAFVNELYFGKSDGITRLYSAYQQMGMIDCFPSPCDQKERSEREAALVAPVLKEIAESLQRAETRNHIIIFKIKDLDKNARLLALDKKFDVTEQFVAFFNGKPKDADEPFTPDVPPPKIGVIDTRHFADAREGINRLIKSSKFDPKNACADASICAEIGNAIEDYAVRRGFSFILDSSKGLPEGIAELGTEDVTRGFISEYNQKNR